MKNKAKVFKLNVFMTDNSIVSCEAKGKSLKKAFQHAQKRWGVPSKEIIFYNAGDQNIFIRQ